MFTARRFNVCKYNWEVRHGQAAGSCQIKPFWREAVGKRLLGPGKRWQAVIRKGNLANKPHNGEFATRCVAGNLQRQRCGELRLEPVVEKDEYNLKPRDRLSSKPLGSPISKRTRNGSSSKVSLMCFPNEKQCSPDKLRPGMTRFRFYCKYL